MAATSLVDATQLRWPKTLCAGGYAFRIVMNRPGAHALNQPESEIIHLTTGMEIVSDLNLSKKRQGTTGQSALDSVILNLRDSVKYSGVLNATPITEDFSYAAGNVYGKQYSTILAQWFNIKGTKYKPNPYWVWLLWYDPNGLLIDIYLFTYDALKKPQSAQKLQNPETNHEQLIHAVRSCQLVSIESMAATTLWRDSRDLITKDMCRQGEFYNGFCYGPNGGYFGQNKDVLQPNDNIGSAIFGPHGYIMQAVPYIDVQPEQNQSVTRSTNAYGFDARGTGSGSLGILDFVDNSKPWPEQRSLNNWKIHPLLDSILTISNPGTGYVVGNEFDILAPGLVGGAIVGFFGVNKNARGVVDSINGSGGVLTFHLTDGGEGYPSTQYQIGAFNTATITGAGSGLTFSLDDGVHLHYVPESYGPWGTWGIPIFQLFANVCETMGFDTFAGADLESAMDIYPQKREVDGSGGGCFKVNTSIVFSPSGTGTSRLSYVNLNVIVGAHPFDGSYWPNPMMFKPDGTNEAVLQVLCDSLLVDRSVSVNLITGLPKLVLTPMGADAGTRPSRWIPSVKPTEDSPVIETNGVAVNYRGDRVGIVAPLLPPSLETRGTKLRKEVLWRLRRIGRSWLTALSTVFDVSDLSWDDDTGLFDEPTKHFRVATCPRGDHWADVQKNPDCWLGLTGLYYYTILDAEAHDIYDSSVWGAFDRGNAGGNITSSPNGDFYGSGDYTKGTFLPFSVEYPVGATADEHETEPTRFDSRHHQAVALATYRVPLSTNLKRSYTNSIDGIKISNGAVANDGTLRNAKIGMTTTFLYDDEMRTFVFTEIVQRLKAGVVPMARIEEVLNGGTFPDINALPHGKDGSSLGSASGGSSYSGSTGGGGGNQTGGKSHWEPDGDTVVAGAGVQNIKNLDTYYICTDPTTTGLSKPAVTHTGATLVLTNKTGADFTAGDFFIPDNGTWFLVYDGTVTQSDPTLAPGWNLAGRSS